MATKSATNKLVTRPRIPIRARTQARETHEVLARLHRLHRLRAATRGGDLDRTGGSAAARLPDAADARGTARGADRHHRAALVGAGLSALARRHRGGPQGARGVQRPGRRGPGADLRGRLPGAVRAGNRLQGGGRPGNQFRCRRLRSEQRLPGRPQRHRRHRQPHRARPGAGGAGGLLRDVARDQRHDHRRHAPHAQHRRVQNVAGHADGRLRRGRRAGHRRLVSRRAATTIAGRHQPGRPAASRPVPAGA